VPRQVTTGGKPRLVGITKRGNKYLGKLLIHGARAAMPALAKSETLLGLWLRALMDRVHCNVAIVALANKLARVVWVVLRSRAKFETAAAA
jgi:transposase